jgi:WD40 repeat protein
MFPLFWSTLVLSVPLAPAGALPPPKETFLLKDHPQPITYLQVSADGKYLFAIDHKHSVRLWDLSSGETRSLGIAGPNWLAFSRDGKYVFSGGRLQRTVIKDNKGVIGLGTGIYTEDLALWATNVFKKNHYPDTLAFPDGHQYPITSAAFSGDGKILVTATGQGGLPGEVKMWDVPSGKERFPRLQYKASAFYPGTEEADLLGLPATLREPPGVELLALSPDGTILATVYKSTRAKELDSGTAILWNTATGKPKGRVFIPEQPIHSLSFTPSGKMLVLGVGNEERGDVWLWNVSKGKVAGILEGHFRPVGAVAISANGKRLASGCALGVVRLWDVTWRKQLLRRKVTPAGEAIRALAFTPDGKTLVVAGGNQQGWIRVWQLGAPRSPFSKE